MRGVAQRVIRKVFKDEDAELKILAKNSSWIFFSNSVKTVLVFVKSVVLARGLGPELYGTFVIIISFVGIIQEILNLNLGTPLIKFGAELHARGDKKGLKALTKSTLFGSAVTYFLSIILTAAAATFFYGVFVKQPGLEIYLVAYAVAAGVAFFDSISLSLLRLYDRFKVNSIIQILMAVIETVVIIFAVLTFPNNFTAIFVAVIIAFAARSIICNAAAIWELAELFKGILSVNMSHIRSKFREIKEFVLLNSLGRTLKVVMDKGDVLIVGSLAGPKEAAYYAIAKKLAYSLLILTDPIGTSIYPQLAGLVAGGRFTEVRSLIIKTSKAIAVVISVFILLAFLFGGELLQLLYGSEYSGARTAFLTLLFSSGLGAVFFWDMSLIFSLGKIRMRFLANAVALLILLFLALVLSPGYGAFGVAISLLMANIVFDIMMVGTVIKSLRLNLRGVQPPTD